MTHVDINARNNWFKIIFFPIVSDQAIAPIALHRDYDELYAAGKVIYDVIINNKFTIVDAELRQLADCVYSQDNSKIATPEDIANYIASFCAEKNIYWEDVRKTMFTSQEIMLFKTSILGKALNDFECYVSQDPILVNANQQQHQTSSAPRTRGPNTGMSSGSGSQLNINNASGLVQPATKINLSGSDVYWVKGKFLDQNARTNPRVHVSPLGGTNPLRVKYKSGQGFDDCILYFETAQAAMEFSQKVRNACTDSKVDNTAWEVKRCKTDQNGYFKVTTELGDAYITAAKLHEMLKEDGLFEEELKNTADKLKKMTAEEYYRHMEEWCDHSRNMFD